MVVSSKLLYVIYFEMLKSPLYAIGVPIVAAPLYYAFQQISQTILYVVLFLISLVRVNVLGIGHYKNVFVGCRGSVGARVQCYHGYSVTTVTVLLGHIL